MLNYSLDSIVYLDKLCPQMHCIVILICIDDNMTLKPKYLKCEKFVINGISKYGTKRYSYHIFCAKLGVRCVH